MSDHLPVDVESLLDRLDAVLSQGKFEHDCRRTALIGLAFCELLLGMMDGEQKEALKVVKANLAGENSEAFEKWVTYFAGKVDSDQRFHVPVRQAALNRLVWTALNKNTGLSGYAADFLVGLGDDAGLNVQQMAMIFAEHVPGF